MKERHSVKVRRMTLQTAAAITAAGGVFYDAFGAFDGCGCRSGCTSLATHVAEWAAPLPERIATSYEDACTRQAFILETDDSSGAYRLCRLGGGDRGMGHIYHGEPLAKDPDAVWSIMRTVEDLYTHPACTSNRLPSTEVPRSIVVLGRRWFKRGPGNTYHTSTIVVDGVTVHASDIQSGYGNAYCDSTAAEWLESAGIVKRERYASSGGVESLWRACERMGIKLNASAIDVSRRKDL